MGSRLHIACINEPRQVLLAQPPWEVLALVVVVTTRRRGRGKTTPASQQQQEHWELTSDAEEYDEGASSQDATCILSPAADTDAYSPKKRQGSVSQPQLGGDRSSKHNKGE